MVKDINQTTTTSSGSPTSLYNFKNKLYFSASNGTANGAELWSSDGTESGTNMVADLTLSGSSTPLGFFEYNNELYFSITAGTGIFNLYKFNPPTDTTPTIVSGKQGFQYFTKPVNNIIYYTLAVTGGRKLMQYDLSSGEQKTVDNSNTEYVSTSATANLYQGPILYNNKIYFYGTNTTTSNNSELFAYDITAKTFTLVQEFDPSLTGVGSVSNFTVLNNKLYFRAKDGVLDTTNFAVWVIDGNAAPAKVFPDNLGLTDPRSFFAWKGKLYFAATNSTYTEQLFVYDPSTGTNTQLTTNSVAHTPYNFVGTETDLYYTGLNSSSTRVLCKTDGTVAGTTIGLSSGATPTTAAGTTAAINGIVFFQGANGTGNELFKYENATIVTLAKNNFVKVDELAKAYPNPATDFVIVSKELINSPYQMYDIAGKMVKSGIVLSEQIDFNLKAGLYFLQVKSGAGFVSQKILVK